MLAGILATGCVGTKGEKSAELNLSSSPAAAAGASAVQAADVTQRDAAKISLAMAETLDKRSVKADEEGKPENHDLEALAYYEKARQQDPEMNDKVARRIAVLYDKCDEQAKAMTEFQEQLKKYPKDANLLNDAGYSYYNRGQWAIAEDHLRRAVAVDKKHKRAWTNLGMTLAQQGKNADAVAAFEKAVGPAEAQANLGFVLMMQKKTDEAKAAYQRALDIEPQLKVAREALAKLG